MNWVDMEFLERISSEIKTQRFIASDDGLRVLDILIKDYLDRAQEVIEE